MTVSARAAVAAEEGRHRQQLSTGAAGSAGTQHRHYTASGTGTYQALAPPALSNGGGGKYTHGDKA